MRLFGGSEARNAAARISARVPRISSGWSALLKSLRENEGQRVLDIGPTSSTNINFLTDLGHSVYMANVIGEAADPKWAPAEPGAPFPSEAFLQENLNFSGRHFDTVLFWDTGDYLPRELREAVVERIFQVLEPGGQLLAFFHVKPDQELHRYHLREDGQIDVQYLADRAPGEILNNRQIENLFAAYSGYKFFLAKDNLREVLVTR
ncbi:MAG: class I SAM-dependent methyltransferase [Janthinobacterium lividum]